MTDSPMSMSLTLSLTTDTVTVTLSRTGWEFDTAVRNYTHTIINKYRFVPITTHAHRQTGDLGSVWNRKKNDVIYGRIILFGSYRRMHWR